MTHQYTFDYHDGDVFWCTADVGWVTGHSYIVYGPLANGATTLMFEGVPTYPDASRFWQVCEKHKVNQFYTAPTAIRALMGLGNEFVEKCDLSALKVLGTVGEPINPEAWNWYNDVVGAQPIKWTMVANETGGRLLPPSARRLKTGRQPLFLVLSRSFWINNRTRNHHHRGQDGTSKTVGRDRCAPFTAITTGLAAFPDFKGS